MLSLIIGTRNFWNFVNRTTRFQDIGFNNLNLQCITVGHVTKPEVSILLSCGEFNNKISKVLEFCQSGSPFLRYRLCNFSIVMHYSRSRDQTGSGINYPVDGHWPAEYSGLCLILIGWLVFEILPFKVYYGKLTLRR